MRDLITRPSLSLHVVTPKELVEQRISAQAELAKSIQVKAITYRIKHLLISSSYKLYNEKTKKKVQLMLILENIMQFNELS